MPKIRNQFNYEQSKCERFCEAVPGRETIPGKSYEMREIVTTFIRTGRVLGSMHEVVNDEDLPHDFDSPADVFDGHDIDLVDYENASNELYDKRRARQRIQELAVKYSSGKISYDDFCKQAGDCDYEIARPFIRNFGEALARSQQQNEALSRSQQQNNEDPPAK